MKTVRTLLIIFALLLMSANAFAATVSIPGTYADASAPVQLPLNAQWEFALTAFQFTITYNPSVLNCTGALLGNALSAAGGWSVSVNTLSGQIGVLGNDSNGIGIPQGSGNLVKLQCTVVGNEGDSTSLQFTGTNVLVDTDINEYVPVTTAGMLTIGACVPSEERCDRLDNDCDGQVDEDIAPVPTTCGVGACSTIGVSICQNGQMVDTCHPPVEGPLGDPTCNDLADNDCNGFTDSNDPNCIECVPSEELCDGLDNDCDGQVDEDIAPVPTTCGVGMCSSGGQLICDGGQMIDTCSPGTPQAEGPSGSRTCSDSRDNDCDGAFDSSDPGCLVQPTGMDRWVGKWFSLKRTMKGSAFRATDSKFLTDKSNGSGYLYIWGWDPNSEVLRFDYYEFMEYDDLWHVNTDAFHFFAGTDDKFLFWYNSADATSEAGLNGLIDGKVKDGTLQNATLKTLGGMYLDVSDDYARYSAGEQTLTGRMIDASKVPVPFSVIIPR